ncbi:MAG: hypothetical protein WCZ23_15350 [Rhodospirillaceae bacterium]
MSQDNGEDQIRGVALTVEGPDGDQMIAVAVPPPADADRVMDLMEALDDVLAEEDPELDDAVTAALILALGNALRQAPQWPLEARLDAFLRRVRAMVEDAKGRLGN